MLSQVSPKQSLHVLTLVRNVKKPQYVQVDRAIIIILKSCCIHSDYNELQCIAYLKMSKRVDLSSSPNWTGNYVK